MKLTLAIAALTALATVTIACSGSSSSGVGGDGAGEGDGNGETAAPEGDGPPGSPSGAPTGTTPGDEDASSPGKPSQDAGPSGPPQPQGSWTALGTGVAYRAIGGGPAVFIAYGGYSALGTYSQAWAEQLWTVKLAAMGVGHLYAVKGPQDAGYDAQEISNTSLRAHMKGAIATGAPFILVAAHSSGAFVANEIIGQLRDANDDATLGKMVYACLDGGGKGLDDDMVSKLRHISFVSAKDSSLSDGTSQNASAEIALGDEFAAYGEWREVVVPQTGCHDGAGWCLHDVLITHKPHDPDMYDLKDDYTDFAGRPATTEWIDMLATYLAAQ